MVVHVNGSSPRVRGTHQIATQPLSPRRFIPACAGNAFAAPSRNSPWPVHPRVCGERSKAWILAKTRSGSSPRVRGTLCNQLLKNVSDRFIPACAGNAAMSLSNWRLAPVHPRVCGERGRATIDIVIDGGSSPRVRGTQPTTTWSPVAIRFIPACAGNANHWRH